MALNEADTDAAQPFEFDESSPGPLSAAHWRIGGRVQGVGYRPFVYRLAQRLAIRGWVQNRQGTVEIFGQGAPAALTAFAQALLEAAPPFARPRLLEQVRATPGPYRGFTIRGSAPDARGEIHVPPDAGVCDACRAEIGHAAARRHRYPFTNCTQCGPRYSIITDMPYDRARTTLQAFTLCPACAREYRDPGDRRFHAQPIACPACGPRLEYRDAHATVYAERALEHAVRALLSGRTVAVKGIGGYHLLCLADQAAAVERLRQRKARPDKPFAVLFPDAVDLSLLRACVELDPRSEALLRDPARPIVLLPKRPAGPLAAALAPGLSELGVMLPYSPLHHLLLDACRRPLVATSANISGEPVLTEAADVEARLSAAVDAFLHHDRPIRRPVDDSVCRIIAGAPRPLRLGRGLTPLELPLPFTLSEPLLAVGGHLKNTVALAWRDRVVLSPHIGDLDSPRSLEAFAAAVRDLQTLYRVRAERVVCDAHPRYASRRWAQRSGLPVLEVPHHHAHAAAVAGEHAADRRWLVFTWDGVGYGADGTLWGGEALLGAPGRWRRAASLRPFRLPGGDRAGREPWRSALALCWELGREWSECPTETALLRHAWERGTHCPRTSSAGRLFDAAAALLGLIDEASYEGQAPMRLEAVAHAGCEPVPLPLHRCAAGHWETDWAPLVAMLRDRERDIALRAGIFHASLAHALLAQALALRAEEGDFLVGLGGGVFQNRLLSEHAAALLSAQGFDVRLPLDVPCNDAGLSYGQIIEGAYRVTLR